MKVVFFWNFLNHHQVFVADEMYKLLGDDFCFVATLVRDEKELKGGVDYSTRPYCILAAESEIAREEALRLAVESDVCVFGAMSQEFAVERARMAPQKLSFECGERWMKRGWLNVLSPVLRGWWMNYMRYYRKANIYKLCSSAFTAVDDVKLKAYKGKHFKWGYFTEVHSVVSDFKFQGSIGLGKKCVEASKYVSTTENKSASILWCARFLFWKHPKLAIRLAEKLKVSGYKFQLDMLGDGVEREKMEALVESLELKDCVRFLGNIPNAKVHQLMREHDIFLFTSNSQEGWGTVVNEAMSNGCCVVGSDAIGSVPYLVMAGVTGIIFKSEDLDSLYDKVTYLIDNPKERQRMSVAGQQRMQEVWSPENAAKNLLQLINDLQNGRNSSILEGPCSKV